MVSYLVFVKFWWYHILLAEVALLGSVEVGLVLGHGGPRDGLVALGAEDHVTSAMQRVHSVVLKGNVPFAEILILEIKNQGSL